MKSLGFLASILTFTATLLADNRPVYTDPAQAGPDFHDQGEYINDWGGAQVIALGSDQFRMVTFRGGLPGAGWDGEYRQETNGQRDGGQVIFTGPDSYRAELAQGRITITTAQGGPWTMEKTARRSPTLGAQPPPNAIVLFDGRDASAWEGGRMDERNFLIAGCKSKQHFTNFTAHVEFMTPFKPHGRGQDRGNSGVYLQDRYEIQVLDSFGLRGENNECGGIYGVARPAVNMCFPPLTWQTYDVEFTAAKWDANGKKTDNARVTVRHNGVLIHQDQAVPAPTAAAGRNETPEGGPFQLQDHGNPVFYRNIWVVPKP
jgi:hypothetical protein